MNKILVLVSTYNGERFLREQLDSVLSQQDVTVDVLVRDDNSTDSTICILEEYSKSYSNFSYYQGKNLGPCLSFFDLIGHADGYDYYAFCDQDDVWDNNKLAKAVQNLDCNVQNIPILYCSNLRVVDEELNYCRLAHPHLYNVNDKYAGLVDFYAVGCTEVFNQNAVDLLRCHIRQDCIMHDSWLFMICNFFGKVIYDYDAHINYRQHGKNVVGSDTSSFSVIKERFLRIVNRKIQPRYTNAKLIYSEFHDKLSKDDLRKILKIVKYKESVFSLLSLLFDPSIRSSHWTSDMRYRFLILLKEI